MVLKSYSQTGAFFFMSLSPVDPVLGYVYDGPASSEFTSLK
jgi:hypothetical protein